MTPDRDDEVPWNADAAAREWAAGEFDRGRTAALWTPAVGRQVVATEAEWDAAHRARSAAELDAWRATEAARRRRESE